MFSFGKPLIFFLRSGPSSSYYLSFVPKMTNLVDFCLFLHLLIVKSSKSNFYGDSNRSFQAK